ncbi:MAG: LPXTG cell wall anchor domain-containing protein [Acidimicrobiales bacterium]
MNPLKFGIPAAILAALAFPAVAGAQTDPCEAGASSIAASECVVEVEAVTLEPTPATPVAAAPASPVVAGKQQLPVTGGDALTLAVVGGTLVGAGAFLTLRARRTAEVG